MLEEKIEDVNMSVFGGHVERTCVLGVRLVHQHRPLVEVEALAHVSHHVDAPDGDRAAERSPTLNVLGGQIPQWLLRLFLHELQKWGNIYSLTPCCKVKR